MASPLTSILTLVRDCPPIDERRIYVRTCVTTSRCRMAAITLVGRPSFCVQRLVLLKTLSNSNITCEFCQYLIPYTTLSIMYRMECQMRRPLGYMAALLLVLGIGAGAGREPIWSALDGSQATQEERGTKGWLRSWVQSAARRYSRWALRRGMEDSTTGRSRPVVNLLTCMASLPHMRPCRSGPSCESPT